MEIKDFRVVIERDERLEFEVEARDSVEAGKIAADESRKMPVIIAECEEMLEGV